MSVIQSHLFARGVVRRYIDSLPEATHHLDPTPTAMDAVLDVAAKRGRGHARALAKLHRLPDLLVHDCPHTMFARQSFSPIGEFRETRDLAMGDHGTVGFTLLLIEAPTGRTRRIRAEGGRGTLAFSRHALSRYVERTGDTGLRRAVSIAADILMCLHIPKDGDNPLVPAPGRGLLVPNRAGAWVISVEPVTTASGEIPTFMFAVRTFLSRAMLTREQEAELAGIKVLSYRKWWRPVLAMALLPPGRDTLFDGHGEDV